MPVAQAARAGGGGRGGVGAVVTLQLGGGEVGVAGGGAAVGSVAVGGAVVGGPIVLVDAAQRAWMREKTAGSEKHDTTRSCANTANMETVH